MISDPVALTVPPMTFDPGSFSTGIGSPEIMDSSTELWPSMTTHSAGGESAGRPRAPSPGEYLLHARPAGPGGPSWAPIPATSAGLHLSGRVHAIPAPAPAGPAP